MREILFKAKRIDNGEWVEGYAFDDGLVDSKRLFVGDLVITDYKGSADDKWNVGINFYEVVPETLCQYIGLTDKNGNKIWENDVIRYKDNITSKDKINLIEHNETHASFLRLHKSQMGLQYHYINEVIAGKCKIIGNIFDNPELLEVADE